MAKIDIKNWAIIGVIVSAITPFFMTLLSIIPMFQLTFSTIAINIRSQITGVSGLDFGNYLLGLLGKELAVPNLLLNVLGGAVLIVLARFVLNYLPIKTKTTFHKLIAVFVLASVIQLLILSGFGFPGVNILVGFAINAVVMAYLVDKIAKQFGVKVS